MLAVFIDAYHAKLRDENGKVADASIFVAVEIDMEAHKTALGWWMKYIYTTNVVESINAGLELMRMELGGYFPSMKSLEVNLFIQVSNLNDRWMRKPVPMIKASLYRRHQLMNIKLGLKNRMNYYTIFRGKSLLSGF